MSERTRPAARAERPRGEQPPEGATARTATRPPVRGLVHSDDERLRRAATGADALGGGPVDGDMAATLRRRRGHGAPLPADVARSMGEHLQRDLSDVRVHADAEADTLSRSVQARAFTLGSDVYFTAGAYNPRSAEGQHLLAHELTHVVQQSAPGAGAVQRSSMTVGRADDPAEVEAERNATRVVQALRRSPAATGAATTAGPVAVEHQHGSGCGHDMTIRRHFLSNLFSRTPPAPPAPPAPTLGARARGLHEVEADDPSALDQLADIADAILAIKDATVTREEKHTLGDMDGGDAAAGLYGSGMGLVKMGMGAKDVFGAAGDLHAARQAGGDSLARNDKGVELRGRPLGPPRRHHRHDGLHGGSGQGLRRQGHPGLRGHREHLHRGRQGQAGPGGRRGRGTAAEPEDQGQAGAGPPPPEQAPAGQVPRVRCRVPRPPRRDDGGRRGARRLA